MALVVVPIHFQNNTRHLLKNLKGAKQDDSTSGEIYLKPHMVLQVQGQFMFTRGQNEAKVVNEDAMGVKGTAYPVSVVDQGQGYVL